jgi:hypothetical protein
MKNKKLLQVKRDNELKRLRLEKSKRITTIKNLQKVKNDLQQLQAAMNERRRVIYADCAKDIKELKKLRLILETKLENL